MSKISVVNDGMRAKVELDGHDISRYITGLTMRYDTANVPTAVIDVVLLSHTDIDAEDADVVVPEPTAELLVRLGWTPPAQEGEGR
jgi:hypothetical protein